MESPPPSSVVSELEGTLLKDPSPFCYFMLVAFEASGIIRFALLLILWPVVRFLELCGRGDAGLKVAIFVATAGVKVAEIEAVARAVLPKFYFDDVDLEAWGSFCLFRRRVVVSKMPRIMVERFAKEHLQADDVVGSELAVNRFGFATGFVKEDFGVSIYRDVSSLFSDDDQPCLGIGRPQSSTSFLPLCKEELHPPFMSGKKNGGELIKPLPVIFHDGRLAKRPTPGTALMILVWIPIGILLAAVRIGLGLLLPIWIMPIIAPLLGGEVIVKGKPPLPAVTAGSGSGSGVLFVCTHRTLMDPVVLSAVLQRKIPAVTYSISRLSEILSPIPTLRLTRSRDLDAEMITHELEKGDVVVCPEGTTCREPFLLRFSALFAELTDRIVPVAMNTRVGFFHATTARGWKGMDPIFFFMNPRPVYEVTFLNQLPAEATCSSGKSPYDVANYVQMILAATLGFECTNFTRKDKYRVLAGNDGTVFSGNSAASNGVERLACAFKKVVGTFKPFIIYSLKQVK